MELVTANTNEESELMNSLFSNTIWSDKSSEGMREQDYLNELVQYVGGVEAK